MPAIELPLSPTFVRAQHAVELAGADPTLISGEPGGPIVRRSVLPSGVRVLTEAMPGQRSATIGFWVGVGSRDEAAGEYGSTHFLEHLLFKGTRTRSSLDIAEAFDRVGGESNAATAKEHTCYYARVLDTDLPMAIDVIADMVTSAVLDPAELEQERTVILEELAMDADDPTDVAHEKFVADVLGEHPLGRPIGGTQDIIRTVGRDAVADHYQRYYRPNELVVTAAGGLDHDVVCDLVMQALERGGWELEPGALPVPRRTSSSALLTPKPGRAFHAKSVEQANVIIGGPSINATDERRAVMSVLNSVFGSGMSSRLFQEVREKRGLAYSAYSFNASYSDAGYFGMYAGTSPAKVDEVVALMEAELELLAENGITEAERERGIGQLSGGIVLGLEDTGSRMSRLGRSELVTGEFVDLDETLARINAVTLDDVRQLAAQLASAPRTITVVAPK